MTQKRYNFTTKTVDKSRTMLSSSRELEAKQMKSNGIIMAEVCGYVSFCLLCWYYVFVSRYRLGIETCTFTDNSKKKNTFVPFYQQIWWESRIHRFLQQERVIVFFLYCLPSKNIQLMVHKNEQCKNAVVKPHSILDSFWTIPNQISTSVTNKQMYRFL